MFPWEMCWSGRQWSRHSLRTGPKASRIWGTESQDHRLQVPSIQCTEWTWLTLTHASPGVRCHDLKDLQNLLIYSCVLQLTIFSDILQGPKIQGKLASQSPFTFSQRWLGPGQQYETGAAGKGYGEEEQWIRYFLYLGLCSWWMRMKILPLNLDKTDKITYVKSDLTVSQEFLISTIMFSLLINITR